MVYLWSRRTTVNECGSSIYNPGRSVFFVCSFFSGSFTFQKYCWLSQSPRVFGISKTFTLFIDVAFFFKSTNSKCLRSWFSTFLSGPVPLQLESAGPEVSVMPKLIQAGAYFKERSKLAFHKVCLKLSSVVFFQSLVSVSGISYKI